MKNKNMLLNIGVALGLVLMIVGICLSIWVSGVNLEILGNTSKGFGIFVNKEGMDAAALGWISEIALVISMALVVAYLVMYVLEVCKVGKIDYAKIRKFLAIITLAMVAVAVICGIIFVIVSTNKIAKIEETAYYTLGVGFYLMAAGGLVSGLLGIFGSKK